VKNPNELTEAQKKDLTAARLEECRRTIRETRALMAKVDLRMRLLLRGVLSEEKVYFDTLKRA